MIMGRLGIVAGGGNLPLAIARGAKKQGIYVVVCCVTDDFAPGLESVADRLYCLPLHAPYEILRLFTQEKVTEVVLVGKVWKDRVFHDMALNGLMVDYMGHDGPRSDEGILQKFASDFESVGITVTSQLKYAGDQLAGSGVLGEKIPSERELLDVEFGFKVAKHIGAMDIGQSVVVKDRIVLAIEAIEGTDATILRGGQLGGPGSVVVKVSRPSQDMRFDVPTVGPETIRRMVEVGAGCLALEAGHAIMVDREEMLRLADEMGVSVVGYQPANR